MDNLMKNAIDGLNKVDNNSSKQFSISGVFAEFEKAMELLQGLRSSMEQNINHGEVSIIKSLTYSHD